ncbi:UDP-N-acetylmuramate dehydrogenase [Skermania sp. ID1734]|uniref:UDP-N-acetylmuramate dehydrogenase n=1 Tax=Skermania sp. ID1734 TaxID=2597516 RepID=UPI00117F3500|nr:UDP-N-acetylmuramate dehydrogenase [Skermania sp. ID1734]TSD99594.1 UDP-N-acetylmuramate dehydrogenase [Skermania sp. ID1734]
MREQVPLASLTTLRVGGPARVVADCGTTSALVATVRLLDDAQIPTLVVAGGSNLLIGDAGFEGVVVRVATTDVDIDGTRVRADAGAVWDGLVERTIERGLGGLECLSGIPGSTGATPVQNVGAYGVEVSSVLRGVQLLDRRSGMVVDAAPAELGLGYRTSVLKHSDAALVLSVEFELFDDGLSAPLRYRELADALSAEPGERRDPAKVRDAVLGLRRGKGMVLDPADNDTWSAGSFFTNPVVAADVAERVAASVATPMPQYPAEQGVKLSAGWLIERAGFAKGYPGPDAPARLSTKHTLALTNRGSASTADLVELARIVRAGVEDRFGVRLEPEPVLVGVTL